MIQRKILVTGIAGFIGYHLSKKLVEEGFSVVGLDNINSYYDIKLKLGRLKDLGITDFSENELVHSQIYSDKLKFIKMNLEDKKYLPNLFENEKFDFIINLAAQAGVRYSIENPMVYAESNIIGFLNLLECMRNFQVDKLIYASSSSVYGDSTDVPFKESQVVDSPISLYAASKKANELMAYTYSHLFNIKCIGLRFFTVYGPWGRPDMAMFLFTDAILNNKSIKVFNDGNLSRDFTYIDDIISGIKAVLDKTLTDNSIPKYKVYNIGNNSPVKLIDFIETIEEYVGKKVVKNYLPNQSGDVNQTWADVTELINDFNYIPQTSIKKGVANFIEWYKIYYNIK